MGGEMDAGHTPVVIDRPSLEGGGDAYRGAEDTIRWIVSEEDDEQIASRIRESLAQVAVIGPFRYGSVLYDALAENARGGPSLLARFGVGYDSVDLARCRQSNIMLTVTPHALTKSVAEHAMGLLLGLARDIPALDRKVRQGGGGATTGMELYGKPLGIAGFGAIGKALAGIASRGFGMRVFAYDELTLEAQAARQGESPEQFMRTYGLEEYLGTFEELAGKVSILSLHLPATEQTRGFFNAERLALMQEGAILINTARGSLIDERALFEALRSGRLRGAGIDVFEREPYQPASPDCDLRKLPNVILTPHVASNTREAREQMALRVVKNIQHYLRREYDQLDRVV